MWPTRCILEADAPRKTCGCVVLGLDSRSFMDSASSDYTPDKLEDEEIFWRDRYYFFKNKGYILRPRYHPKWQPSWRFKVDPLLELFEDHIVQWVSRISTLHYIPSSGACARQMKFLMLQRIEKTERMCSSKELTPELILRKSRSLRI